MEAILPFFINLCISVDPFIARVSEGITWGFVRPSPVRCLAALLWIQIPHEFDCFSEDLAEAKYKTHFNVFLPTTAIYSFILPKVASYSRVH